MIPKQEEDSPIQCPPIGDRATLEGWAAVENEMMKHDEATMKGHITDVDTLLVFAGLFSAVLTAFVVESYQKLQLDVDTGSMLVLRRISVQLESFSVSSGFVNSSTSAPPLPSLEFNADTSTRWINILWFLSLIFSLAAALFGIMVKQWIREYMQWNAALAKPRDNVLIRQVRFEAWNDWNVPVTIATIPALLEIALLFFSCGLVVLLQTLDVVVFIVVTTFVVVFLAIASTFTILPAFFERCPYKSPTAWACAVTWDFVTLWIPDAIGHLQYQVGRNLYWSARPGWAEAFGDWLRETSGRRRFRLGGWTPISSSWRTRDLAGIWSSLAPKTNLRRGDATALIDELLLEQSCMDEEHECTQRRFSVAPSADTKDREDARSSLHDVLRTITELPPLVRALAWVSQSSQDTNTQRSMSSCIESLESRFVLAKPMIKTAQDGMALTQEGVRSFSIWYLLISLGRTNELSLLVGDPSALKNVTTFRARNLNLSTYPKACDYRDRGEDEASPTPYVVDWSHLLLPTESSRQAIPILVSLSALSLQRIARELLTSLSDPKTKSALPSARRAMELLIVLYSFSQLDKNDSYVRSAVGCLVDVLLETSGDKKDAFEAKFPGLRESIRKVARDLGRGSMDAQYADWLTLDPPLTADVESIASSGRAPVWLSHADPGEDMVMPLDSAEASLSTAAASRLPPQRHNGFLPTLPALVESILSTPDDDGFDELHNSWHVTDATESDGPPEQASSRSSSPSSLSPQS